MAIFYTDTGSLGRLEVTGSTLLSGSSNVLRVVGSGSTIFVVSGSTGPLVEVSEINSSTLDLFVVTSGSTDLFRVVSNRTVQVTGSLIATGGMTGSLEGTASWANNASTASYVQTAQTASYVVTAQTASYVQNAQSASYATTASYAVSASWAPGGGGAISVAAGGVTNNLSQLVFSNSNGVSFGLNGSTITATVTPGAGGNVEIAAGGSTNTVSQMVFSNSNNVSFGLNGSTITATAAAGGGVEISAGTTSNNVSQLVFSNANNISFGLNGSTVTAQAGAVEVLSYFNPADAYVQVAGQLGQGSLFMQPAQFPEVQFDRVMMPFAYSNATNSSNSFTVSVWWGVYTRNGSTLSSLSTVSTSYNITNSGTVGSYSLYGGMRLLSAGLTGTLTEGQYYVAMLSRTTTGGGAGMSMSNMVASQINSSFSGIFGQASNNTVQYTRGLGMYSATTSAMPSSIAFSQLTGISSAFLRKPLFYVVSQTF